MLRHFQLATVLKIRGDAGSAEDMIADLRLDAGGFRAPLDHAVGVLLVHGFFREDAWLAYCRSKQITAGIAGDTGLGDIFVQEVIKIVVTGNVMLLAALLMEAQPIAGVPARNNRRPSSCRTAPTLAKL